MVIDTLAYTKKLEAAGVERRVAEAHAEALVEALGEHILPDLATKADLEALRAAIAADIANIKSEILRWMFAQTLATIGVLAALFHFLR